MALTVIQATLDDADDITRLRVKGMEHDPLWKASMGEASFEEQMRSIGEGIRIRLGPGTETGASSIWKAVDEEGTFLGFTGLELPASLSDEQKSLMKSKGEPLVGNERLLEYYDIHFAPLLGKHGYDPEKHFKQLGIMVLPEHQRKGLGKLLTKKVGEIADERGAPLYIEAGPKAAALFRREGYEELERFDINLGDFDAEGGIVQYFIMKREPRKQT